MKNKYVILYLILFFTLALKLYGITFEVPHPDDYITVEQAMHFGITQTDFSGHGLYGLYVWPGSTMVYIQILLFTLYFFFGWIAGIIPDMESFRSLYLLDPNNFYLIGRMMSVSFGVGSVWVLYCLGRRLYDHRIALLAALILASSFIFNFHSQFIRPDIPATFVTLLTLICCMPILERGDVRYYIIAGILTGFAIATKFTSGLLVLPIIGAHIMFEGKRLSNDTARVTFKKLLPVILIISGMIVLVTRISVPALHIFDINTVYISPDEIFNREVINAYHFLMKLATFGGILSVLAGVFLRYSTIISNLVINLISSRKLIYGMIAVFISFAVFNPIFFLKFKNQLLTIITDANYLGTNEQFVGVDGYGFWGNLWWYIKGPLNWGAGLHIEIMAGLGLVLAVIRRRREDMLLLIFPAAYLLVMAFGRYRWERYAVTLMPFMALYSAVFLNVIMDKIITRKIAQNKREVIMGVIAIIIVIPSTYNILRYGHLLKQKDTRVIAKQWVEGNITRGSRIGQDAYTGKLSVDDYRITRKFSLSDNKLNYYRENGYDYLLVSDTQYRRYMNEPIKYKENIEFYSQLFNEGELVKEVKLRIGLWPGNDERFPKYHIHISPTIKIFKIKET